jgi:hypothetical protein
MLSRDATTRASQDYWVTMAEFWFKLARHAEGRCRIMKTRLTKECRDRFGRHSLRPARRSFGRTKDLKSLERVKGIEPSY